MLKKFFYDIIKHKTYNCYKNDNLQHIDLVLIKIKNNLIITGYKSPSVDKNTFETNIEKFVISKYINYNIIFIRDFNNNVNLENSYLEKFLRNKNLLNALPKNISTTNFNTQIDVMFISNNIKNYKAAQRCIWKFFSDHKPIFIGINSLRKLIIVLLIIMNVVQL